MASKFKAEPIVLRTEGGHGIENGEQFIDNLRKIDETVTAMRGSSYTSPAADSIGEDVHNRAAEMIDMGKTMISYGQFLCTSGNTVDANESNIIDQYGHSKVQL